MLLAPAIASPHYFPGAGTISSTFIHISNVFYGPPNPARCRCSLRLPISSSAICMFLRFHLQRFICFSDLILSDLYVFTISSSAIYMFFLSHPHIRPEGIDSRAMLLRVALSCHICWAVLGSPECSCVHCRPALDRQPALIASCQLAAVDEPLRRLLK